jgi:hypothetical protein
VEYVSLSEIYDALKAAGFSVAWSPGHTTVYVLLGRRISKLEVVTALEAQGLEFDENRISSNGFMVEVRA